MYEAPRLDRFGSFRDLTKQVAGKTIIGDDLVPGIGMDCNPNVSANDPAACLARS